MSDDAKKDGLSIELWNAAFRPGMIEFAATSWVATLETDLVRIAFGNSGAWEPTGDRRVPVFTHAVTLPPRVAVEFARQILALYAQPQKAPSP